MEMCSKFYSLPKVQALHVGHLYTHLQVITKINRNDIRYCICNTAGERMKPPWSNQGHANLIMDNLVAEGKIKPFIIVNDLRYDQRSQIW